MENLLLARLRQSQSPFLARLIRLLRVLRGAHFPRVPGLGNLLSAERELRLAIWRWVRNQYCHQIMASRCARIGGGVRWDGDVPLVYGTGSITLGEHVTIGNRQTWVVGLKGHPDARLSIGDYTTINYQTLISVASEVRIGAHCALGGELKIFDNNSHPLEWADRRLGRALNASEVSPVIIEDDVWIGTHCIILKGVRVGRGAVIAAGSVVTRDVPPFTLAGGVPARVLKALPGAMEEAS
jgi:acetyltransferase-like isoleucine patch superfamily enzyme